VYYTAFPGANAIGPLFKERINMLNKTKEFHPAAPAAN
jgi:hypothetical protein